MSFSGSTYSTSNQRPDGIMNALEDVVLASTIADIGKTTVLTAVATDNAGLTAEIKLTVTVANSCDGTLIFPENSGVLSDRLDEM